MKEKPSALSVDWEASGMKLQMLLAEREGGEASPRQPLVELRAPFDGAVLLCNLVQYKTQLASCSCSSSAPSLAPKQLASAVSFLSASFQLHQLFYSPGST